MKLKTQGLLAPLYTSVEALYNKICSQERL